MVRLKESWTIEESLVKKLKKTANQNKTSVSDVVNNYLLQAIGDEDDVYKQLLEIGEELLINGEKRDKALEGLDVIIEEGNKQEREKAESTKIYWEKYKYNQRLKLIGCMKRLRSFGLWEKMKVEGITNKELVELEVESVKIAKEKGLDVMENAVSMSSMRLILRDMDELLQLEYQTTKKEKKSDEKPV